MVPDVKPVESFDRENALRGWQRKLREDGEGARVIVDKVIERLHEAGIRHWAELSRYRSQMLNGCAVPTDFSHNTRA